MSTGTITSVYHMRKRRYQDVGMDGVKPNGKQTKVAEPRNPPMPRRVIMSKSPSPISRSPKIRQSVRDTSVRFLSQDSQPEISWNCQSPEFQNTTPRRRCKRANSDKDMLNLIQNTFNNSPDRREDKKESLLSLWKAPTEVNVSQLPKETRRPDTSIKPQAMKIYVGTELEQLMSKVKRVKEAHPQPVNVLSSYMNVAVNDPKRPQVIDPTPSISSHGWTKNVNALHGAHSTDNGKKCPTEKTAANANSSDTWSDEDLFNDEAFIEQTQKLMENYGELSDSQACTQVLVMSDELSESDRNHLLDDPKMNRPDKLTEVTSAKSCFTALKSMTVPVAGPSKLTTQLPVKSEGKDDLDDFWDGDDGMDEIMCSLVEPQNKDDSLDFLLNCDTQLYPSTNQATPVPRDHVTRLPTPTQILDEIQNKPAQKSPWKFSPLHVEENSNAATELGPIHMEASNEPVAGSSKSSVPRPQHLKDSNSSKIIPPTPKASSRCYSDREIEQKKQAALEKVRRKLNQINSAASCRVIHSQMMPSKMK